MVIYLMPMLVHASLIKITKQGNYEIYIQLVSFDQFLMVKLFYLYIQLSTRSQYQITKFKVETVENILYNGYEIYMLSISYVCYVKFTFFTDISDKISILKTIINQATSKATKITRMGRTDVKKYEVRIQRFLMQDWIDQEIDLKSERVFQYGKLLVKTWHKRI